MKTISYSIQERAAGHYNPDRKWKCDSYVIINKGELMATDNSVYPFDYPECEIVATFNGEEWELADGYEFE